ncbi:hydrolase, alpha beta fold family protein [Seminavis robusta]|uniref:Hydrolase, alpha beta fold family protein n=1 Tax=Seminavis robusta TaxID=568900 RepID=A0A9N8F400_9STRA|nr:hydrolase, alpha beta fold family protein [Seminavis robusta]|eukprot:Sro2763_g336540.1 hydrolase, alpha beta fold family protein (397) ;mRNA; r:6633-7958
MTQPRLLLLLFAALCCLVSGYTPVPPKVSPATGLANNLYNWKQDQQIRYQVDGPKDGPPVVLVHGLFVNSDHWRKTLKDLAQEGYRAYALDLWGCGYSSKPPALSPEAQAVNGELRRFEEELAEGAALLDAILPQASLGSACGTKTRTADIELRHPCKSPYNFYTWSDLITDFTQQIVNEEQNKDKDRPVTIVCNSIGTISSLQAVLDNPDLYKGVFVIAPNFRELHSAEVAMPQLFMPLIKQVQSLLRNRGQPLFDALAKPDTVKQILMEPYKVQSAVDDTLVQVLLDPLLTPGASDVVFDTLSYSAGPLPEVQLSLFPKDKPVWVCYGKDDPWTPGGRVEALKKISPVVQVVEAFEGVGHCPHDEAPELVNPLLFKFLKQVNGVVTPSETTTAK